MSEDRCSFPVELGKRICDAPAVGIYRGIGGDQPVCESHAKKLRERWGIKLVPLDKERA